MFDSTKIKKRVNIEDFIKLIQKYSPEEIECTQHTFFRLSQKQREIFTCESLKKILKQEKPFLAGVQHNDNYAVFYKHQNKNLKIILSINDRKINIYQRTFIIEQLCL